MSLLCVQAALFCLVAPGWTWCSCTLQALHGAGGDQSSHGCAISAQQVLADCQGGGVYCPGNDYCCGSQL